MSTGWLFLQALLFALGVVLAALAAGKFDARIGWAGVACLSGGMLLSPLFTLFATT